MLCHSPTLCALQTAEDNYAALVQFFSLYPEYVANDLFIAGESYAGTYATQTMLLLLLLCVCVCVSVSVPVCQSLRVWCMLMLYCWLSHHRHLLLLLVFVAVTKWKA